MDSYLGFSLRTNFEYDVAVDQNALDAADGGAVSIAPVLSVPALAAAPLVPEQNHQKYCGTNSCVRTSSERPEK